MLAGSTTAPMPLRAQRARCRWLLHLNGQEILRYLLVVCLQHAQRIKNSTYKENLVIYICDQVQKTRHTDISHCKRAKEGAVINLKWFFTSQKNNHWSHYS